MSKFCVAPFVLYHHNADNKDAICCRMEGEQVTDASAKQRWTNNFRQKIREQFLDGKLPDLCSKCWNDEASGRSSYRENINKRFKHIKVQYDIEYGNQLKSPLEVDFRPTNLCNLKCRMCGPHSSSQLEKELQQNPDLRKYWADHSYSNIDTNDLEFMFENVKSAVSFLGGEPTIMPEVKQTLEKLIREDKTNLTIRIQTNGTNDNFNKDESLNLLRNFTKVNLSVSIDGIGKTVEYIRSPIKWKQLDKNINLYKKEFGRIGLGFTLQAYNIHNLNDFLEHYNDPQLRIYVQMLSLPHWLDYRILPLDYRRKHLKRVVDNPKILLKHKNQIEHYLHDNTVLPYIDKFGNFTKKLDDIRGQNLKQFIPELWNIVEPYYK